MRGEPVRWNLNRLERAMRRYWSLEFHETPFPDTLFDAFLVLARALLEGEDYVTLAQLLHEYVKHLESRSNK
jgi:hypothetical protein